MFENASRRTRVLLRLGLYGGAVLVGIPLALAHVMTRTYTRDELGSPPAGYQEVRLESEGLALRSWLAEGDRGLPGVVVVHGLGDSLEAYAPLHAALFRERGHSVILVDLRGHGGSEGSVGTLGAREPADVAAAMQALRDRGLADRGIVLMGHSMGAVSVLRAAAGAPDVAGVVAESPYDTLQSVLEHQAWSTYRMPSWVPVIPLAIRVAEWRGGYDVDEVDVVAAARRIQAPLLVIADEEDDQMPVWMVRRVFEAHPGPKELWVVPGAGHIQAGFSAGYRDRIEGFLDRHGLSVPSGAAAEADASEAGQPAS